MHDVCMEFFFAEVSILPASSLWHMLHNMCIDMYADVSGRVFGHAYRQT